MSETSNILREELQQLKTDIIIRHEQSGQVASGRTKESFEDFLNNDFEGGLLGNNYVGVLERGRKPGRVPFNFKDILKRWAQAKGLSFNSETDFNRWAFFVQKKIREEGTKLFRSGVNEDIFETPIKEFTDRISKRFLNVYEKEITNKIFSK